MIEGIKILLERMKTNPEEFTLTRKWDNLIDQYRHVLTNEEVKAYNDARHELERQKFTEHVLEILLAEKDATDSFVYNTKELELEDRYKELLKLQIAEARKQLKL